MKARKGIGTEELKRINYTQQVGEAAGVKLDFDKISLAFNTTLSHRLIALAPEKIKNTVVAAIYKAYFEDGLDIGNINILASIGTAGMNHTELRNLLSSDAALDEVMNDAVGARHRGITSVPFFIFNNKIRVDGSHSVEVVLHMQRVEG